WSRRLMHHLHTQRVHKRQCRAQVATALMQMCLAEYARAIARRCYCLHPVRALWIERECPIFPNSRLVRIQSGGQAKPCRDTFERVGDSVGKQSAGFGKFVQVRGFDPSVDTAEPVEPELVGHYEKYVGTIQFHRKPNSIAETPFFCSWAINKRLSGGA